MIRLGIDARVLAQLPHHGLGVWRYLVRILERAPREGFSITLFGNRPADSLPRYAFTDAFPYVHVPGWLGAGSDAMWEQVALPADARLRRQQLFWSPSYSTPLVTRVPRVVTMHDILFDRPPPGEMPGPARMRWIGRRSVAVARCVLTDSAYSAQQMQTHWGLAPGRVRVIPLAADEPPAGWRERAGATLARLGVRTPYLLCAGTMYTRRNVGTLIDALQEVLRHRAAWNAVVVGRNSTHPHEDLEGRMRAVNTGLGRDAVRHIPFVSDDDLQVLFGMAGMFVYLSSLEGFGLPPLEAMAYGIPVISTDGGSLREITPGAAVLVDPRSVEQVSHAIERLIDDPAHASECRRRSLARSREFSWDRCADATWHALREAVPDA